MSETINRLLFIYMAQVVLALVVSGLFYFFYRNYKRTFAKWWSFGWAAYAVQYGVSSLLYLGFSNSVISFIILFSAYLHLFLIIVGVIEILQNTNNQKLIKVGIATVLILSLISIIIYSNDPEAANQRYFFRVSVKSFIMSVGYTWISYKIFSSSYFIRSFGKYFSSGAFLLSAIQLLWHSGIVFSNVMGYPYRFPIASYGIIDLLSLSLVALGMVIWMLESEHYTLEKTNHELDSFLYSTSHDLRAPIASILGLTHLGKMESLEDHSKEYFSKIESRVKKLDGIVGDILSHSKGMKQPLQSVPVDIQELAKSIWSDISNINEKVRLYQGEESFQIHTDPQQLTIILHNIIVNAIRYQNPDEANPWINFKADPVTKSFQVSDNGIGIPATAQNHIFNMFYRGSNHHEGSGLGLYIANEAAKRIGASISFESKEGVGSVFTVSFS